MYSYARGWKCKKSMVVYRIKIFMYITKKQNNNQNDFTIIDELKDSF